MSLGLLWCFQKTKQMSLQRQHRTALISIFSCLSCQIILRFRPFCSRKRVHWWSLWSACSPCRSYQLQTLIIVLCARFPRSSRRCSIFVNDWPFLPEQSDDFQLIYADDRTFSIKVLTQHHTINGEQLPPPWAAASKPESFSPLVCSQQRDPDFLWNLNQEMFQRVNDRSPSARLPRPVSPSV